MPIENITFSQKQERLFDERLSIKLNPKNKLYKLRACLESYLRLS
jgi:uncharacterized protein YqkB